VRWTLRRVHKYSAPYGEAYRGAIGGAVCGKRRVCRRVSSYTSCRRADLVVVVRYGSILVGYLNIVITEYRLQKGWRGFRVLKNETEHRVQTPIELYCTGRNGTAFGQRLRASPSSSESCTRRPVGHRSSDQGQNVARMLCRRTARRVSLASACARVVIATLLSITEDVVHEHVDASLCAHRARGRHCCSRNSDRRCWQW